MCPCRAEAGGVPDSDELDKALREGGAAGHRPGALVLTLPDNPTGTLAGEDLVKRVCAVAAEHDLAIVSDEIDRDLAYGDKVSPPAAMLPDQCFVTEGLSKNPALGGWRITCARFLDNDLGRQVRHEVVGIATELWSNRPAPMQEAAAPALNEPAEITAHIAASRALHERVALAVHERFTAAGVQCRKPRAAFYLSPDCEPLRPALAERGVHDTDGLAGCLLDQHESGCSPAPPSATPVPTVVPRRNQPALRDYRRALGDAARRRPDRAALDRGRARAADHRTGRDPEILSGQRERRRDRAVPAPFRWP
ncbi:aminotransferase class I/II-fold pyridoxal phosphate-dependent enzyme [Saccharopolyspora sp. NPDC000995]